MGTMARPDRRPVAALGGTPVLLVGRTVQSLPEHAPWDPRSRWWPWTAAAGPGGEEVPGPGYDVTAVRAARPAGGRARLGRVRALGSAWRAGAPAAWVADLRGSVELRRALRAAKVVWALDADTDAALAALPELVGSRALLPSTTWQPGSAALARLDGLLAEVLASARGPRRRAGEEDLERWARGAAAVDSGALPVELGALDAVTETLRLLRSGKRGRAADRATLALDAAAWPEAGRASSGLAARRLAADLSLGLVRWDEVDEAEAAAAARAAVRGADSALDRGDRLLALARLGDGLSLLFHRARHAEVPRSELVEDPAGYLSCLRGSRTLHDLLLPERPRTVAASSLAGPRVRPRVLVVTGAYGDFHAGVVEALQGVADVTVCDPVAEHEELGRKVLDPQSLPALAVLAGSLDQEGAVDEGRATWAGRGLGSWVSRVARSLQEQLAGHDVVLADWADPATVWISHLCPTARLVVRVHALDALDPWLHLVRWERVERVVTVSEPLRSLVVDLLAAVSGADVPVEVVPHAVPTLPGLARGKTDAARTTLGMIGWGRRVKDVHWTLDLLERDPAWQLVLVGADFPATSNPVVEPFVTRLRERLASPGLRDRVHVVGHVEDVGEPLRHIGVIVSASVRESWHVGLVEGAASGAVPVVRDWPLLASRGGPRTLFPDEWVVDDLDRAEARVRRVTAPGTWEREGARAREQAMTLFDPDAVAETYRRLLLDGRASAG